MFKKYSFISGNNIETFSIGAPFIRNIREKGDFDIGLINLEMDNSTKINTNKKSKTESNVEIENNTKNTQENTTDNSIETSLEMEQNIKMDNSQKTTNVSTMDTSSDVTVSSQANTYNVDESKVINESTSNISDVLQQSCGMSVQAAEATQININRDESITTIINAGNKFTNTGAGATITDITMSSKFNFIGNEVDRSCALKAIKKFKQKTETKSDTSKEFGGGETGDVGVKTGGNTMENENDTSKKDKVDTSVDATNDITNKAKTKNTNTNTVDNDNKMKLKQITKQSDDIKAGGKKGKKKGKLSKLKGGGPTETLIIVLVLAVGVYYYMKKSNIKVSNLMDMINENHLMVIIGALLFSNYIIA